MKKKYAVYPGYITSKSDKEEHFIGADKLMKLYGVNRAECIVVEWGTKLEGFFDGQLISLYPNYFGDYTIPIS